MNVLLIKPYNKFKYTLMPPMGLGYLSKALQGWGINVSVLDASKDEVSFEMIASVLDKLKPAAVGVYFCTSDYNEVSNLVRTIKQYNAKVITVVGGPHVSALPKEVLHDMPDIDFGIVGEGEMGLPMLLKGKVALENIPGLVFRKSANVVVNPAGMVQDLDELGAPDWGSIDPRNYPNNPLGGFSRASPVAYILTSRGCPSHCTFCSGKLTYGNQVRWRSVNNVMDEVEVLVKDFGIKEIHILDDNFSLKKDHVYSFCQEVKRRNIKINFSCSNGIRLESLDLEIFKLMKAVGFYSIAVGIESGSDKILQDMKKQTTTEKIRMKVAMARKAGIEVTGLFIVGYPTETAEDVMKTIDFARKLPLNRAAFTNFLPLPGSSIFRALYEQGAVGEEDWKDFSYYTVKRSYASAISQEQLEKFIKRALFRFYLRPRQIYDIARNISSVGHFSQLVKRALDQLLG